MPKRKRVYERGDRSFPIDFPLRLGRLREAAGLSWRQFARQVGADRNTVRCWRKGQRPNSAYLLALFQIASTVPHGYDILIGGMHSEPASEPKGGVGLAALQ